MEHRREWECAGEGRQLIEQQSEFLTHQFLEWPGDFQGRRQFPGAEAIPNPF
jgi:hypothetical protein